MTSNCGPNPSGKCQCGCGQKTALAKRTNRRDQTMAGLPVRYVRGHWNRKGEWETRESADECLVGPNISTSGYSYVNWNGKKVPGHRAAFEKAHARRVREGFQLHHKCGNRACMNPEHLVEVLPSIHHAIHQKSRTAGVARGERHWASTLTASTALGIKALLREGWPVRLIAKQFGVSRGAVYGIRSGRTWNGV